LEMVNPTEVQSLRNFLHQIFKLDKQENAFVLGDFSSEISLESDKKCILDKFHDFLQLDPEVPSRSPIGVLLSQSSCADHTGNHGCDSAPLNRTALVTSRCSKATMACCMSTR
jgi:hypothetical protein